MHGRIVLVDWQEDEATLKAAYQQEKDVALKPKLHVLWLVRSGKQIQEAAALVGCHVRTAQRWVALYRSGGLALLRPRRVGVGRGNPSPLSQEQQQALLARANADGFTDAYAVRDYIQDTFGVSYHRDSIYPLLRRLGIKKKSPRPMNHKADETVQEAYKKGGCPSS